MWENGGALKASFLFSSFHTRRWENTHGHTLSRGTSGMNDTAVAHRCSGAFKCVRLFTVCK